MKLKSKILSVIAMLVAFVVAGCESTNVNTKPEPKLSTAQIRVNPTPRLQSLTRSYEENLNLITRTQDNRIRGIHDDIQMIFFLNRNTGLTEFDYPAR